ncbi:hypothetical protein [Citrobacter koseri]|uniref:hypothetical protein n=1 Tax=Citrobacter koseri TaxID=545 RepID=UPI00397E86FC
MTRFTKERMKEIRDFDTCVTLEESAELARIALASLEADSDSHPAHGPVSLDRLHRIREILSKAAAQRDGGNIGYAMSDAVKAIDELLEVRKAEPVAWMVRDIDTGEKVIRPDRSYFEGSCQPLYTAPPVPVTIDERAAFNAWNNEDNLPIAGVGAKNAAWLAWQARAKLGSPPAPIDNDNLREAVSDLLAALDEYPEQLVPINRKSFLVRTIRAAMLQGDKS